MILKMEDTDRFSHLRLKIMFVYSSPEYHHVSPA